MAQIKISQLDPAAFLTGDEIFPVVQGGMTLQAEINLVLDRVAAMFQDNDGISWSYSGSPDYEITPSFILTASASDIPVLVIGTPPYDNLQHIVNLFLSPGVISGGAITDAGGGNVNVAAGVGVIRVADDDVSDLKIFEWAASNGNAIPAGTKRFIGVEYNGGAPQVVIKTTDTWNYDTEFPLGTAVRENSLTFVINRPWKTSDAFANIIERLDSESYISRDGRVGGLILSGTGTRNVAVTAGQLLTRLEEYPTTALDTSVSGNFESYYRDGLGAFTLTGALTQWDNANWDDGTGVLNSLTADYFTSLWFYMTVHDDLIMLYGRAEYATLAELLSQDAPPSTIPKRIEESGILIGRLIIQQGATSPEQTESAFGTIFDSAVVSDHGDLAGLGDDDHLQYHTDARAVTWLGTVTFVSSQQVITAAGALTLAHGLGVVPKFVSAHLENVTAEAGYTTGQIASIDFNSLGANKGVGVSQDATNLNIRFGSAVATFDIIHATTGSVTPITNANWRIVFTARI